MASRTAPKLCTVVLNQKEHARDLALRSVVRKIFASSLPTLKIEIIADEQYESPYHTFGFSMYVNLTTDHMLSYSVWKIEPHSPADRAGLSVGDIIDEINGNDLSVLFPDDVAYLVAASNGKLDLKLYPFSTIRLFSCRPYASKLVIRLPAQLLTVGPPLKLPNEPAPLSRGLDVIVLWTRDVENEPYAVLVVQQVYHTLNVFEKETDIFPGDVIEMIDGVQISDHFPQYITNFLMDTSNRVYQIGHVAMSGMRMYIRDLVYRLDLEMRQVNNGFQINRGAGGGSQAFIDMSQAPADIALPGGIGRSAQEKLHKDQLFGLDQADGQADAGNVNKSPRRPTSKDGRCRPDVSGLDAADGDQGQNSPKEISVPPQAPGRELSPMDTNGGERTS